MKIMKNTVGVLFFLTALLQFSSCQKERFQGHFLEEALRIDSIYIDNRSLTYQSNSCGGAAYFSVRMESRYSDQEELEETWSYYNDYGYYGEKQRVHRFAIRTVLLCDCRLVSIDVTTLTDFNPSHPANSSLNDICWYSFPDSKVSDWIAGGYKGDIPYPNDCEFKIGRLPDVRPDDARICCGSFSPSFFIYLDELPDSGSFDGVIVVRDMFGHTYKTEGTIKK